MSFIILIKQVTKTVLKLIVQQQQQHLQKNEDWDN